MTNTEISPFKVAIPDGELDLLRKKLELARIPANSEGAQWGEDNNVTATLIRDTIRFWLNEYNWRREEERINELPQFKTSIELGDFGVFDIHFVHSKSDVPDAIPLLFLHGWPGSFLEVQKIIKPLLSAGFHVVAPSLAGFGFSSYTDKPGFRFLHHAALFQTLMLRLGYDKFVVQGGDWGSIVGRAVAMRYPDNAKLLHINMLAIRPPPDFEQLTYSDFDKAVLNRVKAWNTNETAYQLVQTTKPRTVGFAMHDSPVGMLAWMADKLLQWTDGYHWTPTELITWTLLHYFPGPTTGFLMYRENLPPHVDMQARTGVMNYVKVPTGVSLFPKEVLLAPKPWAEKENNLVFWKVHEKGGHFAAWEQPEALVADFTQFVRDNWESAVKTDIKLY